MLRIGWAQDPETLNPFVGLDEEDFTVWAINWDLLVNFSPKDLSPAPGIAQELGRLRRQEDGHLPPRPEREVVRRQADHLRGRQVVARRARRPRARCSRATPTTSRRSRRPNADTVVIHTSRPDARIVGGLFIYILPKHIWGKVPIKRPDGHLQAEAAAGRQRAVHGHGLRARAGSLTMERNPNFRGPEPKFDEIQFIKYGNQDAVERALQLGEVDMVVEVSAASFARLGEQPNIDDRQGSSPAYTELTFNLCPPKPARTPSSTRRSRTARCARRSRTRSTASGSTRSPPADTSFPAHGILPSFYKSFYEEPAQDYPYRPGARRSRSSTTPAGHGQRRRPRTKGDERALVQPLRPLGVAVQHPGGEAGRRAGQGDRGRVRRPGRQHRQALRPDRSRRSTASPRPTYDTFIWGWGGDPYDPSFLLSVLTTGEIGGLSDSYYSNPDVRPALQAAGRGCSTSPSARRSSSGWSRSPSATCPTWCSPTTRTCEAYRTDRVDERQAGLPRGLDGRHDLRPDSYTPLLTIDARASSSGESGGGGSGVAIAIVAVLVVGVGAFFVIRSAPPARARAAGARGMRSRT